ncbi:Dicer-like protein 1 [Massospora cicadina]|nr:Dicer-like protein 1 [Massospora cicadina]
MVDLDPSQPLALITPRDYQLEIYELARKGQNPNPNNYLLVLDTGAGKTLIAAMLIKDFLLEARLRLKGGDFGLGSLSVGLSVTEGGMSLYYHPCVSTRAYFVKLLPRFFAIRFGLVTQEGLRAGGRNPVGLAQTQTCGRKFIVYLVNNVHLVHQQSKAISQAIPDAAIQQFYGDVGIDLRSKATWAEVGESAEVLVMTAQIFLNVLRHGFLRMSQVGFLVFDECHHARKDHPFNLIMVEFYTDAEPRPQIFGMTASPSNSKQPLEVTQYELSHNLHATIVAPTPTRQLAEATGIPDHLFVSYLPTKPSQLPALSALEPYWEADKVLGRVQRIVETVLVELGPWAAHWILLELMADISNRRRRGLLGALGEEEAALLLEAFRVWEDYRPSVVAAVEQAPVPDGKFVTPKALTLLHQLTGQLERHGAEFRGIVFVSARSVALMLDLLLKKLLRDTDALRSGILLGHGGAKSFPIFQMNHQKQDAILQAFKAGQLNLLIATRVAEEGLDIQPCNAVICYDATRTLVSYIQARGRARAKNSTFVVMYDATNAQQRQRVHAVMELEKSLLSLIRSPVNSPSGARVPTGFPEYEVASTGAKITFNSAVALIMFYCSHLRVDAYTSNWPEWRFDQLESGFRCHLTLPSSCSVRFICGDVYPSKTRAKQSAAFKGCVDLHTSKAIDDHLLPVCEFPEEFGSDLNPIEFDVLGTHKVERSYLTKVPELWQADPQAGGHQLPVELFVNWVDLAIPGRRPFAIATRRPLPALPPIQLMATGFSADAVVRPALGTTDFSADQIIQLGKYSEFIFSAVLRKRLACPAHLMAYFFIPRLPDSELIDWAAIQNVALQTVGEVDGLEGRIVSHVLDNHRLHLVKAVRHDLDADSCVVADTRGEPVTLANYILARFKRKVKMPHLPVLDAEHVPLTTNYLFFQPSPCVKAKPKRILYSPLHLLPENCMLYPIAYDIFLAALVLPSLLSRVDALLLAGEVKQRFHLVDVGDRHIAEALTLPSASLPQDYERLELLGDSFLKFMATVHLYIARPKDDEGKLHCHRIRKICNKALFQKCTQFGLAQYFNWRPLDKAKWRPPNFVNLDNPEDLALTEVRLSDKCLADVMEALLGAAVASGGELAGLRCLMNLGLCFNDVATWNSIRNMYLVPKPYCSERTLPGLGAIQETLGYKFRDPHLLYEALTHPSAQVAGRSYQRLEFLGDAVLDYLVVRFLERRCPVMPPGYLTDLKGLLVDNPTLAKVSEQAGLPHHLVHASDPLGNVIALLAADPGPRDHALWAGTVPKAFSDILESVIGAVFVDSGLDLQAAASVMRRLALPTYRDTLSAAASPVSRPYKHLIRCFNLAGCRGLTLAYTTGGVSELGPAHAGVGCQLYIHRRLAAVGQGASETAARNSAACSLLHRVNSDPRILDGCECWTPIACPNKVAWF